MKKWLSIICISILSLYFYNVSPVFAENEDLIVEAEIGFENRVKMEYPTVLTLTITNNGKDFSGDFVIDAKATYNVGSAIVVPLDIAAGETKIIPVYMEGYTEDYNYMGNQTKDIFSIYEGGLEKGKKIKFSGDKKPIVRSASVLSTSMLVLTSRQDQVSAIENLRKATGEEVIASYTNSKNNNYLTTDVRGLAQIDYIVVDDFAFQDLSDAQQQAIFEWVQTGGSIVFAPTQYVSNAAGIFQQHMPLSLTTDLQTIEPEAVIKYADIDAIASDINIYKASLNEGAYTTFAIDNYLFAGAKNIGAGKIVQLTYPLYDPVITNFKNYGDIVKSSFKFNMNASVYSPVATGSEWTYVNELFETFNINLAILAIGILIYMIIIGPIIYNFMKKRDQREKIWYVIPVVAIIMSLLIFIVGAKDRIFSPQIEQMAFYEVTDDGMLNGYFLNSMLTNKSGNFKYEFDQNTSALSFSNDDTTNLHNKSYIKPTAEGTELILKKASYWSVESVVGNTFIKDVGEITSDLKVVNKKLVGTITSTLPVDLKDVKILSSYNEYEVGSLKSGETLEVSIDINKTFLPPASANNNYYGYFSGKYDVEEEKINSLKNSAINKLSIKGSPFIVGISDVSLVPIELDGGSKQNTLSYFVKPISVLAEITETVELTHEDTTYQFIDTNNSWGYVEDLKRNIGYLGEGKIPLVYTLKDNEVIEKIKWSELTIEYADELYDAYLVNPVTNEEVPLKNGKITIKEDVSQYISTNKEIRLLLEKYSSTNGENVPLPTFTLKGASVK